MNVLRVSQGIENLRVPTRHAFMLVWI